MNSFKIERIAQYLVLSATVISLILGFFSDPAVSKATTIASIPEMSIPQYREPAQKIMTSESEYLRIYPALFGSDYVTQMRKAQAAKQQQTVNQQQQQEVKASSPQIPFPMMEVLGFSSASSGFVLQTRQGAGMKAVKFTKSGDTFVYGGNDFPGFIVTMEKRGIRLTSKTDASVFQIYEFDVEKKLEQFKTK